MTDTPKQKADERVFECDPSLNTCAPYGDASRDPVNDRMNTAWYIRQVLAG